MKPSIVKTSSLITNVLGVIEYLKTLHLFYPDVKDLKKITQNCNLGNHKVIYIQAMDLIKNEIPKCDCHKKANHPLVHKCESCRSPITIENPLIGISVGYNRDNRIAYICNNCVSSMNLAFLNHINSNLTKST